MRGAIADPNATERTFGREQRIEWPCLTRCTAA